MVETIGDEAARLERLVANLLDMTRLESGVLEFRRDWVPADELLGSALNRLDAVLTGRTVTIDLPRDLPLLYVDPVLFEQVLINLLENAARHTPAGTPIEIAARADAERLTIEIADRGPGSRRVERAHLRKVPEGGWDRVGWRWPRSRDLPRDRRRPWRGDPRRKPQGRRAVFTVTLPREATAPSEEPG
jgi:two-component system sensor histidine kinase KdpD